MSATFTSASHLLAELRRAEKYYSAGILMHEAVRKSFSVGERVPWQLGVLQFERLVARVISDTAILPSDRALRYRQNLQTDVLGIILPQNYNTIAHQVFAKATSELVVERLENLNDSLNLAGKAQLLEEHRVEVTSDALRDLIGLLQAGATDIDQALEKHLQSLLLALERYELFGQEGVREHVASLIGEAVAQSVAPGVIITPEIRVRLGEVFRVGKAVLDGFVYLTTAAQGVEWSGHLAQLFAP